MLHLLVVALALLLAGCGSVEEKRIRQLLHEKGFGTRAQGVATAENYVAGGDEVMFVLPAQLYTQPAMEQLFLLTQRQPVQLDGTIFIPYYGSVYVLGMREQELSEMVNHLLTSIFEVAITVHARIISTGKGFYMFGEVGQAATPSGGGGARYVPMLKADLTLLEVMARAPLSPLANLGRVKVIKPDAQNPLVVRVNVREMVETGNTTYNLRIDANDIIYVPPTFFGHISRFFEKLFQPIGAIVRTLFGIATARASYDYLFFDEGQPFLFGGRGRRF